MWSHLHILLYRNAVFKITVNCVHGVILIKVFRIGYRVRSTIVVSHFKNRIAVCAIVALVTIKNWPIGLQKILVVVPSRITTFCSKSSGIYRTFILIRQPIIAYILQATVFSICIKSIHQRLGCRSSRPARFIGKCQSVCSRKSIFILLASVS